MSSPTSSPTMPPKPSTRTNLLTLDLASAVRLMEELGWPRYRARQIFRWLYRQRIRDIARMSDLARADRTRLAALARIGRFEDGHVLASADGTKKFLFRVEDGLQVESILIPEARWLTLCLSTQIGCTLDCGFCLTGTMGLKRNLKAHEIVDQVLSVQDRLEPGERLTNLVLMGMGEPLANLVEVTEAVTRLTNEDWGVSFPPRRITLSTAGLASRLQDMAALGVNLAVSLNATTEAQRDRLMPAVNKRFPLRALLDACRAYPLPSRQKLTFEYVLLAGVNDREADAKRLVRLVGGIRCKINLIPFNPFAGNPYRRPSDATVLRFQAILRRAGLDAFIRKSKGDDILGACGQLGEPPLLHPTSPTPPSPTRRRPAVALTAAGAGC